MSRGAGSRWANTTARAGAEVRCAHDSYGVEGYPCRINVSCAACRDISTVGNSRRRAVGRLTGSQPLLRPSHHRFRDPDRVGVRCSETGGAAEG